MTELTQRYYINNKTGNVYELLLVANFSADIERQDEFPKTAVYKRCADGTIWCRKLDEFNKKFTRYNPNRVS